MKLSIIASLLLTVFISSAHADDSATSRVLNDAAGKFVSNVFSELERKIIHEYFDQTPTKPEASNNKKHKKKKGLPPGLAKKKHLPPGLQKQLQRNGTLPHGLAKRELPSELESQLPPIENHLERVIADGNVLLVDKVSGIIMDIIKDIVK